MSGFCQTSRGTNHCARIKSCSQFTALLFHVTGRKVQQVGIVLILCLCTARGLSCFWVPSCKCSVKSYRIPSKAKTMLEVDMLSFLGFLWTYMNNMREGLVSMILYVVVAHLTRALVCCLVALDTRTQTMLVGNMVVSRS